MSGKTYKKPKKHYKASIIFLAIGLLAGAFLITTVIYFAATGQLSGALEAFSNFILSGSSGLLFLFLIIVIPVLLIILLVINMKRRRKLKEIIFTWQEAVRIAELREREERLAREAEKAVLPDPRFGMLNALDASFRPEPVQNGREVSSLREL